MNKNKLLRSVTRNRNGMISNLFFARFWHNPLFPFALFQRAAPLKREQQIHQIQPFLPSLSAQ